MTLDNLLDKVKKPIYLLLIGLIYLSYFLLFFGIYYVNPKYTEYFSLFIQTFICLFLIIRFHPFREHKLKEFDDKLIFGSGLILLSNLGIMSYINPKYLVIFDKINGSN